MREQTGGALDPMEERAQRDNEILRRPEEKARDMTLRGDMAASSPFQQRAQQKFQEARAEVARKAKLNEKFFRYKAAGLTDEEIAKMGVVYHK